MSLDLVSPHAYAMTGWAVPPAVVAALLAREGIRALVRRPRTDEAFDGGRYLLSAALWLTAYALMLASAREDVAMVWARVSVIGLATMPVFGWSYSRALLTRGPPRVALGVLWVASAWIVAEAWYADTVITSLRRYAWGVHPQYGPVGSVMLGINVLVSVVVSTRFYRDLFAAPRGSLRRRRNESFLVGLTMGTVAYVDFLACYDIAVYPFGYAALLGMLVVLSRGIRRYGLLDQTLTRASQEVLRVTGDGMVAVDPDGRIQLSNPAARMLLGEDVLEGRPVEELGLGTTPTVVEGSAPAYEITRGEHVLEVRHTAIPGEGGRPAGTLVVLRDVTVAREAVRQLEAAKELAEDAAQQKSRFLTTMSHEIRTPLGGVIGTTELLLQTELGPDQREYARVAQASGRHLLSVVNDILDYSRLEAGGFQPRREDFELAAVVRDAVDIVGAGAGDQGLALEVSIDPGLPRWVRGDARALGQVLVNLVGNAIKFTPRGRVDVEVEAVEDGVAFRVRDTGIGIPREQMHRLFQRFSQVDGSTSRAYGGSGLGLAISQRLCEAMGGRIDVDSEEGRGSTFAFVLSLPAAEEPVRVTPAAARDAVRPVEGLRVLLAEDDAVNQMVVQTMLEGLGLAVEVVGHGEAAVDAVAGATYDLVLMDCEMPVMDGYEATERIRRAEGARVPIVALTAHVLPEERDRCLRAGMDDTVVKPVSRDQLHAVVSRWAARDRETGRAASS